MTRLVQISDPHFGTEQAPVAEALVRWVREQAPDAVLLTGDVTQRATTAQFDAARAFLARLDVPRVLAIPGNHDIPLFDLGARLFAPYRRWTHAFGPELEPEWDAPDMLVLGLNTTRAWRHKDGELSPEQIERVARRLLRAAPGQLRIVAVHQPVAVTRREDEANLLHGHERAVSIWRRAGADLIMGGHIHLPFVRRLPGLRPGSRVVWAVQAGTALSSRVRAGTPNSVNLVRSAPVAGGRACVVERWDFDVRRDAFMEVDSQPLALSAVRGPTGRRPAQPTPPA
ncbi:MAG: metallophosphoesterase [Burkholderiaceae bacterium]|nr:metallophosphoesterase [Burkholderiaceae bacterium]